MCYDFLISKVQFDQVIVSFPAFIPESVIIVRVSFKRDMKPVLIR